VLPDSWGCIELESVEVDPPLDTVESETLEEDAWLLWSDDDRKSG
jgi:hypothetical protein